ncbi:MAG: SUMF1/EgtB/PvdO family nonheme iron enzyme, partial [Litorimonas sp.]
AAWQAAEAAATADAYQQYLTSFPQGAFVAQAIAALERLRPAVGRVFSDCDACPSMTVLPGGNDTLGALDADDAARANEKPARPVNFGTPFAIGVREVTFAEYDACVAAGGCNARPDDGGWGRGSRPVINVAFADAQGYASWLSQQTGFTYTLPTEAQWEYAARAGADDIYPGGSLAALCAFANGASAETGVAWANAACTDPGVGRTLPVGTLSANGFGLRDMVGNVAEWTLDCNTLNLRDAPVDGSADARGSCGQRIVRGGSWFSGPDDLRYSARTALRRGDRNDFTGFRVVRRLGD